jgi:RNA polymerase sigma factor (sigma-70 family)
VRPSQSGGVRTGVSLRISVPDIVGTNAGRKATSCVLLLSSIARCASGAMLPWPADPVPGSDDHRREVRIATGSDGGESHRLEDVYRVEAPRLARFLRRRLPSTDDPLDFVQEAFARLAGSSPGAPLRNPEAYLQRIVRNLLIDRSRHRASKAQHVPLEDFEIAVAPDQTYAIEADDMRLQYRTAVEALPPRTREVFLLSRVEEVGYKEIAERLGISIRTVEWHVAQAIICIDKALDRE